MRSAHEYAGHRVDIRDLVDDPTNAADDEALPTLALALDPEMAARELRRGLRSIQAEPSELAVRRVAVLRHKLHRRCVVQYELTLKRPGALDEPLSVIGKVRARRFGKEGFRRARALWDQGLDDQSPDGLSVPEPLGTVSRFQMWLQRRVDGRSFTELLREPLPAWCAARVADAAHKLHNLELDLASTHTMHDELEILRTKLPIVVERYPAWNQRIADLLLGCERLAARVPAPPEWRPIHRDFYSDQVIVDRSRLYLLDFDLLCYGDPALDIGNFLGHVAEHSLRVLGGVHVLRPVEQAIRDRYYELAGSQTARAVETYTTLTLVRHVYLSTQFVERCHLTESLLELCEARLRGNALPGGAP